MYEALSILHAQINPIVGGIEANADKIIKIIKTHQTTHDLILFPELALTGYPPEDLLLRPLLYTRIKNALEKIQTEVSDCHVIVGHPWLEKEQRFNSASVFYNHTHFIRYDKQHLPNYGVFDELRYFTPGQSNPCILNIKNYQLGLLICEDLWQPGPAEQLIKAQIDGLVCINASPFDYKKQVVRESLLSQYAQRGVAIFYVNQVGGQDDLVFDGQSMAFDSTGNLCARAPAFKESLETIILKGKHVSGKISPLLAQEALIYEALICGTRDYIEKNSFPGVLLGLSGGIDSALTLAIAVDALGAERVHAVKMPSRYTADISHQDADQQLSLLGVSSTNLSIEPIFNAFLETLAPSFKNYAPDITEENLQARIRGNLIMALSNKTGKMVLTTSNKSELAVGYTTLYGDMCGGFAVLKDVLKTQVYALARYRNQISAIIPERVITRAPSAELAMNQTDQDSLPPYSLLDPIIHAYMEERLSADEIIARGYSSQDVNQVVRLIKRNEYKRYQAAPGVKISPLAFGRDWRYPLTSHF